MLGVEMAETAGGRMIDAILSPSLSLLDFKPFVQWLFGDVFGWVNLIQIPALSLTAGTAWLHCRPIQAWLAVSLNCIQESTHVD
jgi:hypothetical protein